MERKKSNLKKKNFFKKLHDAIDEQNDLDAKSVEHEKGEGRFIFDSVGKKNKKKLDTKVQECVVSSCYFDHNLIQHLLPESKIQKLTFVSCGII